jgi:hypothetical protein
MFLSISNLANFCDFLLPKILTFQSRQLEFQQNNAYWLSNGLYKFTLGSQIELEFQYKISSRYKLIKCKMGGFSYEKCLFCYNKMWTKATFENLFVKYKLHRKWWFQNPNLHFLNLTRGVMLSKSLTTSVNFTTSSSSTAAATSYPPKKKSVFHMQNIRVNSQENNPNSFGHKKE